MIVPASKLNVGKHHDAAGFKASVMADIAKFQYKPLGERILVAHYIEPEVTQGGIIKVSKTVDESRYQGKIGLIVKLGSMAFKYYGQYKLEGVKPKVGDWVLYFPNDGKEFFYNNYSMRSLSSDLVHGVIANPDVLY